MKKIVFALFAIIMLVGCVSKQTPGMMNLSHSAMGVVVEKPLNGKFVVRGYEGEFMPNIAQFAVDGYIGEGSKTFLAITAERVCIGETVQIIPIDVNGLVPLKNYKQGVKTPILFIKRITPSK
jgi:hypothetical protein